MYHINTVWCPIKVNNNTIELTVQTSFYCILDLLCVIFPFCFFLLLTEKYEEALKRCVKNPITDQKTQPILNKICGKHIHFR